MPPTQIGRGLRELGITWIAAHSPQAKGRVERNFQTAQDRLVKGMRVAGVKTLEEANQYLEQDYLAWWEREMTVEASNPDDAHRPLDKSHNLAASLSHVETRQVGNNYTIRFDAELYQIERAAIVSGLRRANVRVEKRLDGSLAVRYGERYLPVTVCQVTDRPKASPPVKVTKARRTGQRGSDWGKNFDLKKGPKVWQVAAESGHRKGTTKMIRKSQSGLRRWREVKRRPVQGNSPNDRILHGPDCNRHKRVYADSFPATPPPQVPGIQGSSRNAFREACGIYRSDGIKAFPNRSAVPPPVGRPRGWDRPHREFTSSVAGSFHLPSDSKMRGPS